MIGARDPQGSAAASMSDGRPAPDPVWSVFTLGDGNWAESPLPDGCVAVTDAAAITDGLFVAGVVDSAGIIAPRIWLRGDAGWRRVWSHSSGVIPFLQNTDDGLWAAVQRADPDSLMPPPLLHWEDAAINRHATAGARRQLPQRGCRPSLSIAANLSRSSVAWPAALELQTPLWPPSSGARPAGAALRTSCRMSPACSVVTSGYGSPRPHRVRRRTCR
ncbi:MAG: hypothetical protein IPO18_19325 [bacterium]|nr:hypothetical protein [bacterium]